MAISTSDERIDAARTHLEQVLRRLGATSFVYGWDESHTVVEFVLEGRRIRFLLPVPDPEDPSFTDDALGRPRNVHEARGAYNRTVQGRWRAMTTMIQAKADAVAAGVASMEEEFLGHVVVPSGATVFDEVADQVADAYDSGHVEPLLITAG